MDIQGMMKQAQQLQKKFKDLQANMANIQVTGTAGGGMVEVIANGKGDIQSIKIDESLLKPEEAETLSDLIVAALKNAKQNADSKLNEDMKTMGIPSEMLNF